MYLRLAFWTVAGAYTAFIFARGNPNSAIGTIFLAVFLGTILGFSLGGMFVNRSTRKRS